MAIFKDQKQIWEAKSKSEGTESERSSYSIALGLPDVREREGRQ